MNSSMNINVKVQDEQSQPIPHVSVWAYVLPRSVSLALDGKDLRHLTKRYWRSWEQATPFNRILPQQLVMRMGDQQGKVNLSIDYRRLEGAYAQRPGTLTLGLAILKDGYQPGYLDWSVEEQRSVDGDVVLRREGKAAAETTTYLQAFDRVRAELSELDRTEEISLPNEQRIADLCSALEKAATQAVNSGDRPAAARIYARMQHLPAIRASQGRARSFSQTDPYSQQAWSYLLKAHALDPQNPYIAAEKKFREGAEQFGGRRYDPATSSAAQRAAFEQFLIDTRQLMCLHGQHIWPAYHELYALWHRKASDPRDRALVVPLLEQLAHDEPKFQTREELLKLAI